MVLPAGMQRPELAKLMQVMIDPTHMAIVSAAQQLSQRQYAPKGVQLMGHSLCDCLVQVYIGSSNEGLVKERQRQISLHSTC